MRFFPFMFMIADAEDEEAHRLCVREYLKACSANDMSVTDGFFDCACFHGAAAERGSHVFLHRCLQHTKENVRSEAKKKDDVTGKTRLQNGELIGVIVEWLEFSAWLPSDQEFTAFWKQICHRMESSTAETDFNEPAMARYLKRHIFDLSRPSIIRAHWQYGFGCVPPGYTTYAPKRGGADSPFGQGLA